MGLDWGGNYTLQGHEVLSAGLDLAGIVDPTGVADATNAVLQANSGEWLNAAISVAGLIPYLGDAAKVGKVKKDINIIEKAVNEIKAANRIKYLRQKAVKDAWKFERELVIKNGEGTRIWTKSEIEELIHTGKVKGYEGHHINNVKDHPELVGESDNVVFLRRGEHLNVHGGNFRNETNGFLINRKSSLK